MAFTRFNNDPSRIQKYLEESTNVGKYFLNVPGNGINPSFINDPHIRMQKWGGNLSNNIVNIESDLRCSTRQLNRDNIKNNNYLSYINNNRLYNVNATNSIDEITQESRTTLPAWTFREIDSINVVNNFKYLHLDPQEHVSIPFYNNISTRILEKDYYSINNNDRR